ncbi:MAG: leucyl aminopeptidase [Candidatus Gracilibacteria bacterium]|jgi:leucyl aminopeptidase
MIINLGNKITTGKHVLVVPIFEGDFTKSLKELPLKVSEFLAKVKGNKDFSGKKGEKIFTYIEDKNLPDKLLLIGLGKKENFKYRVAKESGAIIGKNLKAAKAKEAEIFFPTEVKNFLSEILEGIFISQYETGKLKTKFTNKENFKIEKIKIFTVLDEDMIKKALDRAKVMADASDYIKDLVNYPSNIIDAHYLENEAKKIAKENGYKIEVLGKKELTKIKAGGILAVNQASKKEPKLIVLRYNGAKNKNEKPIAIVGKGIVFDTGGLRIKPGQHMDEMHQDMAGSAVVLGLFKVLKTLNIRKNIVGVAALAENSVGSDAYKPSDIITMLSGITVEINNTDAEGRVILGDAVTYSLKYKPKNIITIATLTGAVCVAIGHRYSGLIGNDGKIRRELLQAGREVDDLGWPLPLHPEYKKAMESKIADIRNNDKETANIAGSSKGAAFIEKFVEKHDWCHIDIASTAFTDIPKPYETKGATASGFYMLLRFLEKY